MVKIKCRAKPREYKRLNSQEVHRLVSEGLQEHFPLLMEGRTYEAQAIWDVLIAAAAERLTIEGASEVLEAAPSPNTLVLYRRLSPSMSLLPRPLNCHMYQD